MPLAAAFKGLILGFSIAAPVGPIGILCIRRSLAEGRKIGLAVGLGAAAADSAYGAVAGFGLTSVSGFLVQQKFWLGLFGGLFLCLIGFRTFRAEPVRPHGTPPASGAWAAFSSTFALTLANPMTILSFAALFAGFGLGTSPSYLDAALLVAGVFIGSAAWWLLLSHGIAFLGQRSGPSQDFMRTVNRLSGTILLAFGIYSLVTLPAR